MIMTEIIMIDGVSYTFTRSDQNKVIRKVGTDELYNTALDPGTPPEYEETETDISAAPDIDL